MPSNLILHCGAHAVSRAALSLVSTPAATDTWQPIPHERLLTEVERLLPEHHLTIESAAHGLTHDGSRYFGLLQVRNGGPDRDYGRVIGLRNSHDKRFPAGLVVGSSVFVCDNLSFSGEIEVARKHTSNILRDLPSLLSLAMSHLASGWLDMDTRVNAYKQQSVSNLTAHDLTIAALDDGVICASKIPDVLEEWRHPRHDAFAPRNVWSWFNAVTEVSKGRLHDLPERTQRLHKLCDRAVGLS